MNRRTTAPTIAALAMATLTLVGCSSAGPAPSAPASRAPSPAASPVSTPLYTGEVDELLVLRRAAVTPASAASVIDPGAHRVLFEVRDGLISPDWKTLVSVNADGDATRVEVSDPEGGSMPVTIRVAGAWRLPTIGLAARPIGLSSDGRIVVLEAATATGAAPAATTKFAIVPTSGSTAPRIVSLSGSFTFDAISPDGRLLYLIEHLGGADPTHYQVRQLDARTGVVAPGVIVDKRNIDEQMTGYAITQQLGRNGWVYTLYRGDEGAFIHALDTATGAAFCIDLPGTDRPAAGPSTDWGLALDPTGDVLYAADPVLRTVSAIDLGDFSIRRTASLAAVPGLRFAKLEAAQPAGGRLSIAPDGTTLYLVDTTGITVIRAADLATLDHLAGDRAFRSVVVGAGGTVYAIDEAGHAVAVEAGAAPASVVAGTWASIEAIVPLR